MAQIGATLLLLHLFSLRNFAVGNTFAKTETVQAVLFGLLLLGDRVGRSRWRAILVSLVGLVMLSGTRGLAAGLEPGRGDRARLRGGVRGGGDRLPGGLAGAGR